MIYTGKKQTWVGTPTGLYIPEDTAREVYAERPTAGDLFAGCGGMSLGFIQAGLNVVFALEYDCLAVITYMANLCRYGEVQYHLVEDSDGERMEKALWKCAKETGKKGKGFVENFPTCGTGWISGQPRTVPGVAHIIIGDVRKVTGEQISEWIGIERGKLDCLAGGPPCQGFSTAGRQNIADPRNNLVFEFGRLVCELNPRTLTMENVPGIVDMVTPEGVPVMDELAAILERGSFSGHTAMKRAFESQSGIKLGRQRMGREKKETKKARRKRAKAQAKAQRAAVTAETGQFDLLFQ